MNRNKLPSALLLIGSVALAAMTAGHALVLALGPPAGYGHVAQTPAFELAVVFAMGGIAAIGAYVVRAARHREIGGDWALPGVSTIQALGATRVVLAVVSLQMASLFVGESLEQRAAGIALGGLAGLFGSTLGIAPLVHLAIGIAAGVLLWMAARAIRANASKAFALVRTALGWLNRRSNVLAPKYYSYALVACGPQLRPLAHNLANRPPPASARLA